MQGTLAKEKLIEQKLQAFEQLQPEFEASFRIVQEVQGQRRFHTISVAEIVSYLHALWLCECKDRLLSVYRSMVRYEGQHCLSLLQGWQAGESAAVVEFLQRKLDGLPFADLTYQMEIAKTVLHADDGLFQRLLYGRLVLLNREMNLLQALDAIFSLPDEALLEEVRATCAATGHTLSQIEQQRAEVENPLFAYAPHPRLSQRNMLVMNALGVKVTTPPAELPGKRSWQLVAPAETQRPFAESIIRGYQELSSS
ncbi:hypothetical protein KDA_56160 [Dictyobacter alpinus]|uniref:Uncharacterized protein n=1 Tax=Dictyobacter alpinus TaxID=2014873 RepID=A0A402BFU0_9CHLR|nr:hypothetical protein [Dictyobacter alpinus]GCE30132.1 hypothetical protein KDA_56160 [Dictyobacter alpinus]